MLTSLPKELLLEIFDYLAVPDLLALSTVCRTFNLLINNTKLVEKFTLNFDRRFGSRDWIGSRRYAQLRIEIDSGGFGILRCIGDDLRRITLSAKSIDLKTISRILTLCPNATHLKFVDVKTHSCLDLMERSDLPRHRRVDLWIENTTPNILEIFTRVEVRELTLLAPTSMSDFGVCWNVDDCRLTFNRFMRSQTALRVLTMRDFKANASIFSDAALDEVPFRLHSLRLQNFAISNGHFRRFLANHAGTLESVWCDSKSMSDEFMAFLAQCPALGDFHFSGNLRAHKSRLRSVRKMSADFIHVAPDWPDMFPNLRELSVSSSCELSLSAFEKFARLERLEIFGCHFYDDRFLDIPSVRFLSLCDITFDHPDLFRRYPKRLEELHVDSVSVEFLPCFLASPELKLRRLVVRNPYLYDFYKPCLFFDPKRIESVHVYKYAERLAHGDESAIEDEEMAEA